MQSISYIRKAAFQTLDRMDREGLEGDHDTMEYKIMAYVQSGKLDEAKRLTMEFVENAPLYARNAAEMVCYRLRVSLVPLHLQ